MEEYNFDEIRPYRDNEIHDAIVRALNEPEMVEIIKFLYPGQFEAVKQKLLSIKTVHEFQLDIISKLILGNHEKTGNGIEINGLDQYKHEDKHVYISNHRDIVLDAGFLDSLMIINGIDTAENAIGDNLCAKPWITEAMKMNKNFIVKRSGTKREIFDASKRLSAYIRHQVTSKSCSVWIAEREGRAKDANDVAQESVIKMFSMSSGKNIKEGFMELNIVPVSISYEYDACDYLKAKEFQLKRDDPEYKKTGKDDIENMKVGIMGYRGHVHFEMTECLNKKLDQMLSDDCDRATAISTIVELIDKQIHQNYLIYPVNYIALDERNGDNKYADKYTAEEKANFDNYIQKQLDKIDIPNKDIEFLRGKMLEIYSNPLINKIKASE